MFSPLSGGLFGSYWYHPFGLSVGIFIVLLVAWSLAWKGWALWVAASHKERWWFVVLLLINTAGILDMIYIFGFAKEKNPLPKLHATMTKAREDIRNRPSDTTDH